MVKGIVPFVKCMWLYTFPDAVECISYITYLFFSTYQHIYIYVHMYIYLHSLSIMELQWRCGNKETFAIYTFFIWSNHIFTHVHIFICVILCHECLFTMRIRVQRQSKGSAAKLMAKATFAASSCWWAAPYIDTCTLA